MKLSEIAGIPEINPNDPLMKPGFRKPIDGTTLSPTLRRALSKLATKTKMQKPEAAAIIQAFVELVNADPATANRTLRYLKNVIRQISN